MKKNDTRKAVASRFNGRQRVELERSSREIAFRLLCSAEWESARAVLLYMNLPDEVKTLELVNTALKQGKQVYLPRVLQTAFNKPGSIVFCRILSLEDTARSGMYGISEPVAGLPLFDFQDQSCFPLLAVVPGRAFDREGNRLGRGSGYYDRFLSLLHSNAGGPVKTAGICFSFQIVDECPVFERDVTVDFVITENTRAG